MKILIIGTGPVASVLAGSIGLEHEVALASRTHGSGRRTLDLKRVGIGVYRPHRSREVRVVPLGNVSEGWDLVVTTASPQLPAVSAVLRDDRFAAIAGVTQVPSEVAALQRIAGTRPWALFAPGFLAWGSEPTKWWRVESTFTLAGPAASALGSLLGQRVPLASIDTILMKAAMTMSIVAGLQVLGFEMGRAVGRAKFLARAADEARQSIATAHGLPAPRRVPAAVVWAAMRALPLIAPMNLRDYMSNHFGGHTEQTVKLLDDWIAERHNHALGSPALAQMRQNLGEREK